MIDDLGSYRTPTFFIDSDHEAVARFSRDITDGATTETERAVRLFYAVRDDIPYDFMDGLDLSAERFKASSVLQRRRGFCIPKAVLLAAACRSAGIPCRLRFADVRNHLAPDNLKDLMATDVFLYHGLVEMHLAGRWVKATPAFDKVMCERHGVRPIEFNGVDEAVFHEFDLRAEKHMEYLRDHGFFADLPYEPITTAFRKAYPKMYGRAPTSCAKIDLDQS